MSTFRLNELGSNYDDLDDFQKAESYCREAIESGSPSTTTYNNFGWIFLHRKKFQETINIYENAINIGMESGILLNNLGSAYFYNNQYEKSVKSYKKALDYNDKGDNAFSFAGMAKAQIKLLELDEALINVREVMERDPEYFDAIHRKWALELTPFKLLLNDFINEATSEGRNDILLVLHEMVSTLK